MKGIIFVKANIKLVVDVVADNNPRTAWIWLEPNNTWVPASIPTMDTFPRRFRHIYVECGRIWFQLLEDTDALLDALSLCSCSTSHTHQVLYKSKKMAIEGGCIGTVETVRKRISYPIFSMFPILTS